MKRSVGFECRKGEESERGRVVMKRRSSAH